MEGILVFELKVIFFEDFNYNDNKEKLVFIKLFFYMLGSILSIWYLFYFDNNLKGKYYYFVNFIGGRN